MMNQFFKLALFPLLCLASLNACAVRVTSSDSTPAPAPTASNIINTRLNLAAYPGSQGLDVDTDRNGSSKVRFASNDSLEAVNAYFHREIGLRGWQRTRFEQKGKATKIEATYARQGADFKYKLDREGNSGRYKLEIDFDGK